MKNVQRVWYLGSFRATTPRLKRTKEQEVIALARLKKDMALMVETLARVIKLMKANDAFGGWSM